MKYNNKNQQDALFMIHISEEYCSTHTEDVLTDVIHLILGAYKRKYIENDSANLAEN